MKALLRYLVFFSVVFVAVWTVPSCTADPIRVGFILPFSGPLAEYGVGTKNYIAIAMDADPSLSAAVTPIYEDSGYDSAKSVAAYKKLVTADKVDVVYAFGAPMLQAIAPLAEKDKIPFFAPESDGTLSAKFKYTVLFINEIGEQARALLSEMRARGWRRSVTIKNENQFLNNWHRGIVENLKPDETLENFASVDPGTTDFRSHIPKLVSKEVDALGVFLLPGSHRAFISQLAATGKKFKFFGSDGLMFTDDNKGYFEFIEGSIIAQLLVPETLHTEHAKRFGDSWSKYYAIQGYRFMHLLGRAVSRLKAKKSGEQLLNHILTCAVTEQSNCEFEDPVGTYVLKTDTAGRVGKYFSFPIAVYEIRNGEPKVLRAIERPE